jgi:acyl-coenzyme A thioesterase PaaI-like protein
VTDASKIHISYDREGFWGFPDVPFHQQMGIEFEREPDGSAVVSLPHEAELVDEREEQSPAALYSVAEIASALRVCDELSVHEDELPAGYYPVMLAREVRFRSVAPARSAIAARTRLIDSRDQFVEKLRTRRKSMVRIAASVTDAEGAGVADAEFDFYVRIMSEERLLAMTAAAVGS